MQKQLKPCPRLCRCGADGARSAGQRADRQASLPPCCPGQWDASKVRNITVVSSLLDLKLPAAAVTTLICVGSPCRRTASEPLLAGDSNLPTGMETVLRPINAALAAMEVGLGRPLFPFRLAAHDFPACRSGVGVCALWEGSTGRVWIDAGLVDRLLTGKGITDFLGSFASKLVDSVSLPDGDMVSRWLACVWGEGWRANGCVA